MEIRIETGLPAPNDRAFGLRITDQEFAAVMAFLENADFVSRAWIFGSRHNGTRRDKEGEIAPPDIDLAVELGNAPSDDDGDLSLARFHLRHRIREYFDYERPELGLTTDQGKPNTINLDFAEPGTSVLEWVEAGATLIFQRPTLS